MKRILFVDDEPRVLDGLRDLFRKQRKEWDMVFAPGGPEGVAALDAGEFDVVVSDMRMPVMDGNAVLHAARERHPAAARVILSGHAGREAELSAMAVAHQFVSKPCDPATLKSIIERACALPALLRDERLRGLIGALDKLPSTPTLYWELTRAMTNADVSMGALAALVEQDPAMTAKVLQLVNSAAFGSARQHTSVQQALTYLGTQRLKALALSAQVFAEGTRSTPGFDLAAEQQHAARVSTLAQRFLADASRAETAFTAGLLHDVGRIVLATCAPEADAESAGVTHAEAGAYLLALWGLPLEIVEAVQHHHAPPADATDITFAVHVADALAHESASTSDPTVGGRLRLEAIEASPFGSQLSRWRAVASAALAA